MGRYRTREPGAAGHISQRMAPSGWGPSGDGQAARGAGCWAAAGRLAAGQDGVVRSAASA